jgi:hypothetical protein
MHCLKLRHALLAGDRSSSAAIASTIGYSNHPTRSQSPFPQSSFAPANNFGKLHTKLCVAVGIALDTRNPAPGKLHTKPCVADLSRKTVPHPTQLRLDADAQAHIHKIGVRQPAVVRDTDAAPQNRASFRDRRTDVYRSAVRQPAVAVGNTFAQIQARLFAEPPTVYVRVAVAFAGIVTTGG